MTEHKLSVGSRLFLSSKPRDVESINIVDSSYEALCKAFSEGKMTFEEFNKRCKALTVESNPSNERTLDQVI